MENWLLRVAVIAGREGRVVQMYLEIKAIALMIFHGIEFSRNDFSATVSGGNEVVSWPNEKAIFLCCR